MKINDFLKRPISGKNYYINQDDIIYSPKKTKKDYIIFLKNDFIKKYFLMVIGIFLGLLVVIINSIRVKEIRINGYFPINDNLKNDIKKESKSIFGICFLKENIVDLNYKIRKKYNMYEWISIEKVGNVLFVKITKEPVYQTVEDTSTKEPIIARNDGIIKHFLVYKGTNMVHYNKSVKKGDIIIDNKLYDGTLVNPRGLVIAEVYLNSTIRIPKKEISNNLTGKAVKQKEINLFGWKIKFGKNKYSNYEKIKKNKFNLFGIINYNHIHYYEKSDIITLYDKDMGFELATSKITRDFEYQRVDEKEKILEFYLLATIEEENSYIYQILTKQLKNIT